LWRIDGFRHAESGGDVGVLLGSSSRFHFSTRIGIVDGSPRVESERTQRPQSRLLEAEVHGASLGWG
jgi:hypothetical protein